MLILYIGKAVLPFRALAAMPQYQKVRKHHCVHRAFEDARSLESYDQGVATMGEEDTDMRRLELFV